MYIQYIPYNIPSIQYGLNEPVPADTSLKKPVLTGVSGPPSRYQPGSSVTSCSILSP